MFLLGVIIYVSLFAAFMVFLFRSAPVGYENETGFHYGNDEQIGSENKAAA